MFSCCQAYQSRSIDAELVHVSHDATPAAIQARKTCMHRITFNNCGRHSCKIRCIQAGIVETQKKLEAKKDMAGMLERLPCSTRP